MDESVFVVNLPPVGIVQRHGHGFIEWAPGNGAAYRLFVQRLPAPVRRMMDGRVMISVQSSKGNFYRSYVGSPGGLFTLGFVEEKFEEKNDSLYYITALINWAIYGNDSSGGGYAQTMFDEAQERWK